MVSHIHHAGSIRASGQKPGHGGRLQDLFDKFPEGLILVDALGIILDWNRSAERLLGWTHEQVIGRKLHELILPPHFHSGDMGGPERLFTTHRELVRNIEISVLDAAGHELPVELNIIDLDGNGAETAIVIRDIRARRRNHFMLQMQRHILEMIATGKSVQSIMDELCILIELEVPKAVCSIMRPDEKDGTLHVQAGPHMPDDLKQLLSGIAAGNGQGSCSDVFHTRQIAIVSDTSRDPRWKDLQDVVTEHDIRACWTMPIRSDNQILGTFVISLSCQAEPGEYELGLLETASWLAGIALAHDMNQQRIHLLAMHDDLTGLPNRKMLFNELHDALEETLEKQQTGAVMFLDLDNFKTINDSMGHRIGDEVLRETTRRLRQLLGENDMVARMGGDEFIIIQKDADPKRARKLAERVRDAISSTMDIDHITVKVTTSIGIALFPDDAVTTTNLLKHADTAMYMAKNAGRNNIQFYLPFMDDEPVSRKDLHCLLSSALDNNRLLSLLQPIVRVEDNRLLGIEVLLRWKHPTRGLLDATEFLPLIDELGLSRRLGRWSLENAARLMSGSCGRLPIDTEHRLSVNLCSSYFLTDEFDQDLDMAFKDAPCNLGCLLLEITLDSGSHEYRKLTEKLRRYHRRDIELAIDNLGADHVSLYSQGLLPVDYVKLDVSLVRDIPLSFNSARILDSLIDVAHANRQQVIAVGIETEDQLDYVRKQGCDAWQGYLYSEPLKPEELAARLANNT